VGYLLHWWWPLRPMPAGSGLVLVAHVVGWVFIAASIMLPIWAARLFHRAGTTPNPMRPTTALVFTGPYRLPATDVSGFGDASGGPAMVTNALWPLLTLAPVVVAVRRLVIDCEERYLEAKSAKSIGLQSAGAALAVTVRDPSDDPREVWHPRRSGHILYFKVRDDRMKVFALAWLLVAGNVGPPQGRG